ncbi:MAG: hypothetical protein PHY46_01070 [Candidatus Omnitrophica bacterium]|nr:hypothetical protein [Candidatus Omnitrophota bacterium]MDD5355211.1 hypothetical protein [Candidatus Omnitrophota bacterium]
MGLLFFRFFTFVASSLSLECNYYIGSFFGAIFYLFVFRHRRVALDSLTLAFPEKSLKERKRIARESIALMIQSVFEVLYFVKNPHRLGDIKIEGRQYLDEALKQGRGVIGFTAHFGNFPLMDLKLVKEGYPVNIVLRPMRDAHAGSHVYHLCDVTGIKKILSYPREKVVKETIGALRANQLVVIQMDQNFGTGGVWVDFFGKLAATPVGPIVFSLRTKAVMLPMYMVREGMGRHCIKILPPQNLEIADDIRETVLLNAAKITKIIEGWIREHPEQWGWIHRRWKSRPSEKVKKAKFKVYNAAAQE